ncbi:MAG: phenylacetate-CoA oxygenase subunit PaaC [Actinomycetia bacterium]|nr:phenylacetate-CoA oxygenase subunit PaaC [Actinomycetes bacterium]
MGSPLVTYLLRLGDDNLILSQRLGELVSWMPELEEDIAVANLALDHLGQARNLFTYAGEVEGLGRDEDDLAMLRHEREYSNAVMCEQPNGDFGQTMARQLLVDAFQVPLYEALTGSSDETLAGIAAKAAKEARYHLRHSSTWVVRLGDGTAESHRRMQAGIEAMWPYIDDLFWVDGVDDEIREAGIAPDMTVVRDTFERTVARVLAEATLEPPTDPYQRTGGRTGFHTEHLGHILPEMQNLHRAHPGVSW